MLSCLTDTFLSFDPNITIFPSPILQYNSHKVYPLYIYMDQLYIAGKSSSIFFSPNLNDTLPKFGVLITSHNLHN